MRPSRSLTAPVLVGSLFLLTACSGQSPDDTGTGSGTSTEAPADEENEEEAPADLTGAECLEGSWLGDSEAMREAALSAPGVGELNPTIEITGESVTTFDGGTMTTEYQEQESMITLELEGQEFVSSTSYDGTVTAAYTATDTEVTVTDIDTSGLTASSSSLVDGEEIEVPGLDEVENMGIELGGTSTYTCEGDTLTMEAQYEGEPTGIVQTLTRR